MTENCSILTGNSLKQIANLSEQFLDVSQPLRVKFWIFNFVDQTPKVEQIFVLKWKFQAIEKIFRHENL